MAAIVHLEDRHAGSVGAVALSAAAPPARARRAHDGLVLGLLALVLLAAVAVRVATPAAGVPGGEAAPTGRAAVHVVEPGDSYWSIAAGLQVGGDLRAAVDRLVEVNGRRTLQPGDQVVLTGGR